MVYSLKAAILLVFFSGSVVYGKPAAEFYKASSKKPWSGGLTKTGAKLNSFYLRQWGGLSHGMYTVPKSKLTCGEDSSKIFDAFAGAADVNALQAMGDHISYIFVAWNQSFTF